MKNSCIELGRFIAALLILMYHLGIAEGSWIFVEFFFMITGYYTMIHIKKYKVDITEQSWFPISYTFKKFKRIFPYTCLSIIVMWLIRCFEWGLSLKEMLKWLLCLPAEVMLIGASGMKSQMMIIKEGVVVPILVNEHMWYISCMLLVMPLVICLLQTSDKWKSVVLVILPLVLYGILVMKDGTINGWHDEKFSFIFLNMRAIAGMLLGACVYFVADLWRIKKFTMLGRILLTLLEIMSFVIVAFVSIITGLQYDVLLIGLLFLTISLTVSGVTYTVRISNNKINLLGALSLPLYCMQLPIIYICRLRGIESIVAQFLASILASVLALFLQRWLEKIVGKGMKSILGKIID